LLLEDRVYDYFISFLKILRVELGVGGGGSALESAMMSPSGIKCMLSCALITKTKGVNRKYVKI
jgi:hypothetical protein